MMKFPISEMTTTAIYCNHRDADTSRSTLALTAFSAAPLYVVNTTTTTSV